MKSNSLQTRICFTGGLCLFISGASLVLYGLYSSTANQANVGTEVSALIESSTIREVQMKQNLDLDVRLSSPYDTLGKSLAAPPRSPS